MYDDRDYSDLQRTDIAVYNFRGYTVLKFKKETKELEFGKHANMCSFIKDDFKKMAQFLDNCYNYSAGLIENVDHVEVD